MAEINDLEYRRLLHNLQKLPEKMQKGIFNLGVKAGAKTFQGEAQDNVNIVDDGTHHGDKKHSEKDLKDSIIIKKKTKGKTRRDGQGSSTVYTVGINLNGKAWFAHLIEFGSKLHSPSPFMTPAFEQDSNKSMNSISAYIKRRFDNAVKKGLL